MTKTNVFQLSQPGTFADPLTEVLRDGARALLAQAVEAEAAAFLSMHADKLEGSAHIKAHSRCSLILAWTALWYRDGELKPPR